jgi:hypothetical protein
MQVGVNVGFKIPDVLLSSAYFDQGGEPAWLRQDALKVIDWATDSKIAILGGEIWLPTSPGPTIAGYYFDVQRREGENWQEFVKRANRYCADYVTNSDFGSSDLNYGRMPYFNLTLSED